MKVLLNLDYLPTQIFGDKRGIPHLAVDQKNPMQKNICLVLKILLKISEIFKIILNFSNIFSKIFQKVLQICFQIFPKCFLLINCLIFSIYFLKFKIKIIS